MKIVSIVLDTYMNMLVRASRNVRDIIELKAYSSKRFEEEPERLDDLVDEASRADAVFLYQSSGSFWETARRRLQEIGRKTPIVCVGHDPSLWMLSTVKPEVVAKVHFYMVMNGEENYTNMLRYIAREVGDLGIEVAEPRRIPGEGLYHPEAPNIFDTISEYLDWYNSYKSESQGTVGILFPHHYWVNDNLDVEDALIRQLEALGLSVIPAFSHSSKDEERGCKGSSAVVCEYFLHKDGSPRIDAFVKLSLLFLGSSKEKDFDDREVAKGGIDILKRFDVPVFAPVTSYHKTIEEWETDKGGLGAGIALSIAMPEFEGVIEPLIIGGTSKGDGELHRRMPIKDRCCKIARRVANWIKLRKKPVDERKVGFILHNNPCASVEAMVGGGSHLDTLESVARVMHRLKEAGYSLDPPADGKELIETIMDRKAISEFRWTTVDEIVKKGGVLKQVTKEEYEEWFDTLSTTVKERMNNAWGKPPGEAMNGVPAAMVYEGRILITGVDYGNIVVCVQPKRGCVGARCDGQVCRILHDPDIPPPHQYMATYRYLERDFGVDVIVHVGTHGNLEFLPGKDTGLSGDCYPDIAIGDIPHLYIYNADNSAQGTIAKRRSYAVLVDHMQTVMTQGGLYEELEELDRFLGEYEQIKNSDAGRAHALRGLIMEAIESTNLDKEIKLQYKRTGNNGKTARLSSLTEDEIKIIPFDEIARGAYGVLSRTRTSQIQDGMHILGDLPEGEKRVAFINAILRYDAGEEVSLRKIVAGMMGMNLSSMLKDGSRVCPEHKKSFGELLEDVNNVCSEFIRRMLSNESNLSHLAHEVLGERLKEEEHIVGLEIIRERLLNLNRRIDESLEIDALQHGLDGGYIPPGPSGVITRGRDDILPTGRNFYSLDPHRIPTKAAWQVGQNLANTLIEKHKSEEGRIPENVAIFWMCSDIMWSGGEGMAQIFHLLGVKPVWLPNGRVKSFEIVSLEELGRPRVDVTIRLSGITRDNFPDCMELVDEAVQAVAALPEPLEMNFVRKHSLAQIKGNEENEQDAWRRATLRIFSAKPGTYGGGVSLAIYASAWKDQADLSDIFVYWNGYAYGKGIFGEERHKQLIESLKTVDITFNKVITDEYDPSSYFGTHGGITAAARHISGKEVRTYCGDTREPEHVEVRDMADEIRRVARTKLLNPKWIEGQKRHGYKGAGEISKRIGDVYGWEATTQEVDDWVFDDITKTFIMDEENRQFFEEHSPWALEEIARRLLEAAQRGLWDADPEVLQGLREYYIEIEGWLEEKMGEVKGEFQGGAIDIFTSEDVADWGEKMREIKAKLVSR